MKFLAIVSCLVIAAGCAEVLETPVQGINTRAMPKSYRAPTPETVVTGSNWEHVGRLETGGKTQMGRAKGLVAFDAKLVAGQDVTLRNFSGGWSTVHIFGVRDGSESWETIVSTMQSSPIDAKVEGSHVDFAAPFTGHYLVMLEPILEAEIDYLLRLDCRADCD